MNKHILIKSFFTVILITTILMGCRKDLITNSSDLIGQLNNNKFFELGTASAEIVNGKVYHDTTLSYPAIAIQLSGVPNDDMIVTGIIDTSISQELIDYYKSNDFIASNNAFGLLKDTLTIHAGVTTVSDSLYGKLIDARHLDSTGTYLIPVRLSASNNDNLISNKVSLFRMQFVQNNYYGRMGNCTFSPEDNPSAMGYSSYVSNYGFCDVTVNRINNNDVGDVIFNVTPGVSSPFYYASLKVKGGVSFDNSIVNDFKTLIDTVQKLNNYAILPSNDVNIETDNVVVSAGNYSSFDYLVYRLTNLKTLSTDSNYLFCMNLPANSDTNYFPPDPDKSYTNIFVRVKCVDLNSLNIDVNNAVVSGNMIDRSNWKVNSSSGNDSAYDANYYANKPSAAIDGDVNTYWAPGNYNTTSSFYIDMNTSHTVKGFRIFPNYYDLTMDILRAEILTSNDGVNWSSQGYYFGSVTDPNSSVDNPDYKYIHFNNAVNAQYYQIRIVSTTSYWGTTSIPEIVGFE